MESPEHDLAAATMQDGIVGGFGEDQSHAATVLLIEPQAPGHTGNEASNLTYLGAVI